LNWVNAKRCFDETITPGYYDVGYV
jgi:hypothetical protein